MKEVDQLNEIEKRGYDRMMELLQENPNSDPATEALRVKLYTSPFRMSREEQDILVKLYVEHGYGTDINQADWTARVGMIGNGVGEHPMKNDGVTFWRELQHQIPDLISDIDRELLIRYPGSIGVIFDLISYVSFYSPKSPLISPMMTMIHAYK